MANSNVKVFPILFLIFFISPTVYSQTLPNNQKVENTNLKYGVTEILKIDKKAYFDDGLAMTLTSFSHKRPYTGGPTKATAYITVSKGEITDNKTLSAHGTEADGKPNLERYDSLIWKEYELQLRSFQYDKSIELIVTKVK